MMIKWLKAELQKLVLLLTHLRIRHKLGIAFVGFSIFPLMVIGGYAFYVGATFLRETAIDELSKVAGGINYRLNELASSINTDLNALLVSNPANFVDANPSNAEMQHHIRHWLDQGYLLMRSSNHYARLNYITEFRDNEVLHLQRDPYERKNIVSEPSSYSWAYYKILTDDLTGSQYRMTPVEHIDHRSDTLFAAFTFAVPDRAKDGVLRGILVGDIFADHIFTIIESGLIGREHFTAALVDGDGNYLYHSARKQNWNRLLVEKGSDAFEGDFSADLTFSNITDSAGVIITSEGDVVYHTPIDIQTSGLEGHYFFYLSQPGSIIFATLRKLGLVTLVFTLVFGLIALVLSNIATRQFVLPIYSLKKGADIIAKGNFDHRLSIRSGDEIEELSSQFNAMARFIQERDNKLNAYSSNLEDQVARRTDQLRREQQQVLQAEKLASLGEMAAVLAHEIRNSMTSAKMLLQLFSESERFNAKETKRVKVVLKSIGRVDDITSGLLAFAKPDPLNKLPTDIEELVNDAVNLYLPHLRKRDIDVNISVQETLPPAVIDRELLREVVANIILNADYAIGEHGQININVEWLSSDQFHSDDYLKRLSVHNGAQEGQLEKAHQSDFIKLTIIDDGAGIPEDALTNIFDPFFTTKAKGTGLGLSFCP
jgi:signal transduction histidine kinase